MTDFQAIFGDAPAVRADAPGRVNLIGEHTDYNGGFVLPTAIPQRTSVELAPRAGRRARVWSREFSGDILEYELGAAAPGRGWLDYVQGVTATLAAAGHRLGGFDLRIESSVPPGSGLASSAALEVSLLRALRAAFGLAIDDLELALLGQRAENDFVGARVGIMDQLAASLADEGVALFVDTRSLDYERVPLPPAAELIVISSGLSHGHAGGEYNARRADCERACELLGVPQLRDLAPADLPRLSALPQPLGRRARHVVTENQRVLASVAALRSEDVRRLGELLFESHRSLRDDYEVSIPQLDLLVELGRAEPDVYGARLTGGGFGGSVVMLARRGRARAAAKIASRYAAETGHRPTVLLPA
jgi:galactokinase